MRPSGSRGSRSRKLSSTGRLSGTFDHGTKRKRSEDPPTPSGCYDVWGSLRKRAAQGVVSGRAPLPSLESMLTDTCGAQGPSPTSDRSTAEPSAQPAARGTLPRSVRLARFVGQWATGVLDAWLAREGPSQESACQQCGGGLWLDKGLATGERGYRCIDCFLPGVLCKRCTLLTHQHQPFHRQEMWDVENRFWTRESLGRLGLILDLGHGGRKCVVAPTEPRRMTVVHSHGLDELGVRFCACLDEHLESRPHALQLIAHGLWPGSWEKPVTVFTMEVLKDFHLLSLQSQLTALDFYRYLQRRTDNIQPDSIADRYRELLFAMQEFIWTRGVKRAGLQPSRQLAAGSLAILCPTCPQPNMNMDPRWKSRPENMRYLEALYTTMDGNFQQNQRQKPSDPNDFALSEGAAYFAHIRDFKTYQEHLGPLEREPSTCHKFGAMGYGGYGGRVSGTVGLSCARHMFVLPSGGVDLEKGEGFANVDFATISGLQRWMQLLLIIAGYDINCQYRKNFKKRMKWFEDNQQHLVSIKHVNFPTTLAVVGKFHLPAHTASCRYKFSYHWMPGAGRTDGEAPERIWAVLNGLVARTREMAAGHRHNIINDHHSDMNTRRTHDMARSLTAKHTEAVTQSSAITDEVAKLEAKLAPDKLREWKAAEAVYLAKVVDLGTHEGLENPYEMEHAKAPSRKQTSAHLSQEMTTTPRLERRGVIGVIEEGISLQELRLEICEELKSD